MDFEVYCDESRHELFKSGTGKGPEYVLIGGIWIEAEDRPTYKESVRDLRRKHSLHGEFKWNRVSPSKADFYLDLVHLFFQTQMRFRTIVLPARDMDAITFHKADNELMFYKFYYQLLHHWIEDFNRYRIFVDLKTNRVFGRPRVLREVLDNSNLTSQVLDVQALPSEELDLLQLTDVFIGAVGYRFHQLSNSPTKLSVVHLLEDYLGKTIAPTSRSEEKFNIFLFKSLRNG